MERKKMIPIGIEDLEELQKKDFYYADKTGMIRELLMNQAKVTLFTRPRRFGKSLNMSMLAHFFSLEGDKSIFDGLEISGEKALCEKYMGKYPVIFLSLKGIDALNFETAFQMAVFTLKSAAGKVRYLLNSKVLDEQEKADYRKLLDDGMSEAAFANGLKRLSELLEKHHGKTVILLIDEYDVPLARAHVNGYYDRMVSLMRSLLGEALKTNTSLEFAVLTGCLRISKESIFTGLNNLKVRSITDVRFDKYFGFTDEEVKSLLSYYGYSDSYDRTKEWYDGYRFGNTEVYCPWDVLNYCDSLLDNPNARPGNYWINTSGNDAVKRLIETSATGTAREEIESLVAGNTILKEIREDLTYSEIYNHIENLWSLLFATGYLTQRGETDKELPGNTDEGLRGETDEGLRGNTDEGLRGDTDEGLRGETDEGLRGNTDERLRGNTDEALRGNTDEGLLNLAIPNLEVRDVFVKQIREYFKENVRADTETLNRFCDALLTGDADAAEDLFTQYLERTISIRDNAVQKIRKENFYHGCLLGILSVNERWSVRSNREGGDGYPDILVKSEDGRTGIVIELKYADDGDTDAAGRDALEQIERLRYADAFRYTRVKTIRKYGIGCYKKQCRVMLSV